MIASIMSILTSAGFGAITGLVGSWLTKREERKSLELIHKHDEVMAQYRQKEAESEMSHEIAMADKHIQRAETEGQIAVDLKGMDAFTESLKEQTKTYGIKIVDTVRGLMRPVITVYLLVILSLIAFKLHSLVGGLEVFGQEKMFDLYSKVVDEAVFLCTVAVTWWFGSRPSQRRK